MFKNSGRKLQQVAILAFILCVILVGLILRWGMMNQAFRDTLFIAIVLLIAGYISSLMISAFGDISEALSDINRKLSEFERHSIPSQSVTAFHETSSPAHDPAPAPKKTSTSVVVKTPENRGKVIDGKTYVSKKHAQIICPWCETEQASGSDKCIHCGEKFNYTN